MRLRSVPSFSWILSLWFVAAGCGDEADPGTSPGDAPDAHADARPDADATTFLDVRSGNDANDAFGSGQGGNAGAGGGSSGGSSGAGGAGGGAAGNGGSAVNDGASADTRDSDATSAPDTSTGPDAGSPPDAGGAPDGSRPPDANAGDARTSDASSTGDTGSTPDASSTSDASSTPDASSPADASREADAGTSDASADATNDVQPAPDADGSLADSSGDAGSCRGVVASLATHKASVDIIVIADNSSDMTEEITGIQTNLNTNFAQPIGTRLDYRIVLVSKFGAVNTAQSICIPPPLASAECSPLPAQAAFGQRFFQYDTEISSTNSLSVALDAYTTAEPTGRAPGGWSDWLRPSAFRFFVEVTTDDSATTAAAFETALFAKSPAYFGSASSRNYVFHSIVGISGNLIATTPREPNELKVATSCSSAVNAGGVYQDLSILTGGLRYSVCETPSFDGILENLARRIVQRAPLTCRFALPTPPNGQSVDTTSMTVSYDPSDARAVPAPFSRAANLAACTASRFYVDANEIVLCPAACSLADNDFDPVFQARYDCTGP